MPSCRSATICSQISAARARSEEHTSELQSRLHLVCRLLLEKKKNTTTHSSRTKFLHTFKIHSRSIVTTLTLVHPTLLAYILSYPSLPSLYTHLFPCSFPPLC